MRCYHKLSNCAGSVKTHKPQLLQRYDAQHMWCMQASYTAFFWLFVLGAVIVQISCLGLILLSIKFAARPATAAWVWFSSVANFQSRAKPGGPHPNAGADIRASSHESNTAESDYDFLSSY